MTPCMPIIARRDPSHRTLAALRYTWRDTLRGQIAAALHLMVQVARLPDGQRRVAFDYRVRGLQGAISSTDLFRFERNTAHVDLRSGMAWG